MLKKINFNILMMYDLLVGMITLDLNMYMMIECLKVNIIIDNFRVDSMKEIL